MSRCLVMMDQSELAVMLPQFPPFPRSTWRLGAALVQQMVPYSHSSQ